MFKKKFFKWMWRHNKANVFGGLALGLLMGVGMMITGLIDEVMNLWGLMGLIPLVLSVVVAWVMPYLNYKATMRSEARAAKMKK